MTPIYPLLILNCSFSIEVRALLMKGAELKVTKTGGRSATTRLIPPKHALAVGMPSTPAPKGWRWSALTELARLESGHTPSRRHPEPALCPLRRLTLKAALPNPAGSSCGSFGFLLHTERRPLLAGLAGFA